MNNLIRRVIKYTTNYTNGIYCLQSSMIPFVTKKFNLGGTIKTCIIIYLFSYLVSFIGMKIFGQSKLKYLFI